MGFSVSGATAVILVAFLISFGAFYTAATGTFDQIQDAQTEQTETNIDVINTDIEIGSAVYNSTEDELVILANNTGATTVELENTDLLVDGELVDDWRDDAEVDGESERTLWLPQQTLEITIDSEEEPERVKLVTEHGIAATATVEVVE